MESIYFDIITLILTTITIIIHIVIITMTVTIIKIKIEWIKNKIYKALWHMWEQ